MNHRLRRVTPHPLHTPRPETFLSLHPWPLPNLPFVTQSKFSLLFVVGARRAVGMSVGVLSRQMLERRRGPDGAQCALRSHAHQQVRQGELRLRRLLQWDVLEDNTSKAEGI